MKLAIKDIKMIIFFIILLIFFIIASRHIKADDKCYDFNISKNYSITEPCYKNDTKFCIPDENIEDDNYCEIEYTEYINGIKYQDNAHIDKKLDPVYYTMIFNTSDRIVFIEKEVPVEKIVEKIVEKPVLKEVKVPVNITQYKDKIVYKLYPWAVILILVLIAILIGLVVLYRLCL